MERSSEPKAVNAGSDGRELRWAGEAVEEEGVGGAGVETVMEGTGVLFSEDMTITSCPGSIRLERMAVDPASFCDLPELL